MQRITKSEGLATPFPGVRSYEVVVLIVVVLLTFRLAAEVGVVSPLGLRGNEGAVLLPNYLPIDRLGSVAKIINRSGEQSEGDKSEAGSLDQIGSQYVKKITGRTSAAYQSGGTEAIAKIQPRASFVKIGSRHVKKITGRMSGAYQYSGTEAIAKIQPRTSFVKIGSRHEEKITGRTDLQAAGTLLSAALRPAGNFAKI